MMTTLFASILLILSCNAADILPDDYWGTYLVTSSGHELSSGAKGYTNWRWKAPMNMQARFPIGSNTKLFTSVATYQLQERGLLNVNDSVTDYLDASDFKAMGLNITKWCPIIYGDQTKTCQNITFVQLMSMSSGLLQIYACQNMYNKSNPLYPYCWDFCSKTYLPYVGTLARYVVDIIKAPMIFKPGTEYNYCNMNFILLAYIIEKLSGLNFGVYLQQNIFDVLGMENSYCDLWDGQFGDNPNRVDEYYLTEDAKNPLKSLGIGWCHPVASMGMSSGSGCIIANNYDMNLWYTRLFDKSNDIPAVFTKPGTRDLLIQPYTLMSDNNGTKQYYAQGVFVTYNETDLENKWPQLITYGGATFCSHTSMKMVPNETLLVISAFSNAIHAVFDGEEGLNKLKYDTPYSVCEMAYQQKLIIGDNGGQGKLSDELLKIYSGGEF